MILFRYILKAHFIPFVFSLITLMCIFLLQFLMKFADFFDELFKIRNRRSAANEEEGLPVIGRVAAGAPILAQQNVEDSCKINPEFFHPKADYLLRVRGMSMKDIGIFDGDLLAVHTTREARNGQIVVARIDDEVTVKRFQRTGNKVLLIAENPEFAPIEINLEEQDLVIEGLSVGVIRR